MELSELLQKLDAKQNGAFINVVYTGELPLTAAAKKAGMTARKVTEMTIRKGIDYDKQQSVQNKIANGKVLTHELPWGNWKAGHEGLIIEHKGQDYVRLYAGPNKAKTKYFINGTEQAYADLEKLNCLVNSFFKPKMEEKPDAMTIKISNILEIL